ncbi:polymer-forming cytoskeletal protein [bacterium]|nr:polymer-forming cytoskeletal protein [bacterium]
MAKDKNSSEDIINTILGENTKVIGDINVKGSVRIDGYFKGNLEATGSLTVGVKGELDSPRINVKSTVIGGKVTAELDAPEGAQLQSTANFTGNIRTKVLIIEEGAIFHGSSEMKKNDKKPKNIETREDEYIG